MGGGLVRGSCTSERDPALAVKRGRYAGIGWPSSSAEIRWWIPGTVVIVALTIWGYVSIGPNGRLEPGRTEHHRTDFTVFTEAGAAFFDGRDPYKVANPRGWHYLYPPLFALIVAPLSVFDTESQVLIWYVVNVGLAFGCFGEARRLWRLVSGPERDRSLWVARLACMTAFLPFLDCMQAGQLGIAILYLLMLGFRLVLRDQARFCWFLGGLILALPAVIKLVPSLPVGCLLFQRWSAVALPCSGRRAWTQATTLTAGVLTGVLLFLLVIPASLVGWRANLHYLTDWRARIVTNEHVGAESNFNIHSYRNQSLANGIYLWNKAATFGFGPESERRVWEDRKERVVHPGVKVLVGLILAMLLSVSWSLGRREDRLDQTAAYALACCATLLVSPLSWGHYYMAEAPAVLFVTLWLLRTGRSVIVEIVAVIPPVLSWSYYVAMPYTGGLGLLGLGTTAWFLGICGWIVGHEVAVARSLRGGRPSRKQRDDRAGAQDMQDDAQRGDAVDRLHPLVGPVRGLQELRRDHRADPVPVHHHMNRSSEPKDVAHPSHNGA
jgi:Glycosyltransferase family 87